LQAEEKVDRAAADKIRSQKREIGGQRGVGPAAAALLSEELKKLA